MDPSSSSPKRPRVSPMNPEPSDSDPNGSDHAECLADQIMDPQTSVAEKQRLVEIAVSSGIDIIELINARTRMLATAHNSAVWCFPPEVTTQVFAKLDTKSLCRGAATCSALYKCARDPLCYTDIDLTTAPKVNDAVISTMIQRAGKNLQSLKLGSLTEMVLECDRGEQGISSSCLLALSLDGGAAGSLLRSLHLHKITIMKTSALCSAISACQSLADLEMICLNVDLKTVVEAVSTNCHSIERLIIEIDDGDDESLDKPTCTALVNGCPSINSLGLRGFNISDQRVRLIVQGLRNLKWVDFSASISITGSFLRNLGRATYGEVIEFMILRDCWHLKETEVGWFLSDVDDGDCKFLMYLDVSSKYGLADEVDHKIRRYNPWCIPDSRELKQRPDLCLVANFPSKRVIEDNILPSDSERSEIRSDVNWSSDSVSTLDFASDDEGSSDGWSVDDEFHDDAVVDSDFDDDFGPDFPY